MNQIRVNVNEIQIREAEIGDAATLLDYVNKIAGQSEFLTFGVGEFDMTVEDEEKMLAHYLEADNKLFIIAEHKGKIIGTLNYAGGQKKRTAHTGEFGVSILQEFWGIR